MINMKSSAVKSVSDVNTVESEEDAKKIIGSNNNKKRAFPAEAAPIDNVERSQVDAKKQKPENLVDASVSSSAASLEILNNSSKNDKNERKPAFVDVEQRNEENCASALSSVCSSPIHPSSFIHPSSADQESTNEGVASVTSATSSVSSSASFHCPPPPPTTPISAPRSEGNFHTVATPKPSSPLSGFPPLPSADQMRSPSTSSIPHQRNHEEAEKEQAEIPKPLEISDDFKSWNTSPRYELMRILGKGSYGEVAQAKDLHVTQPGSVPKYVAIKRISTAFQQDVDALRLFREIHLLRRLRGHDCIIQLIDIEAPGSQEDFNDLYLVFEYVDTDLYKLIMSPQYLTTAHIRTFLYQMLKGLKFLHASFMIHRDLKPANILLNEDCSLKICDFGLARLIDGSQVAKNSDESSKHESSGSRIPEKTQGLTRQLTKHVVTRWYRAPELILIQPYTTAVDIWSVGCIFAELLSMQEGSVPSYEDRVPLFPGGSCFPLSGDSTSKSSDRMDQLSVIFGVIGTPSNEDVESIGNANEYIKTLKKSPSKSLECMYPAADPQAIELLKRMLEFNPSKRCTADEALKHDFLKGVGQDDEKIRSQNHVGTATGVIANEPLVGPDFLNSDKIRTDVIKENIFKEVSWFKKHNVN